VVGAREGIGVCLLVACKIGEGLLKCFRFISIGGGINS